jgi:hypothetical protein
MCAVVPLAVVTVFEPPLPAVTPGFAPPGVVPLPDVFVAPPVRPVVADVFVLAVPVVVPVPRFGVPVVPVVPPGLAPPGVVPPGFAPPGVVPPGLAPGAAAGAFAGAFGAAAGAFGALGADFGFCAEAIPGAITNAKITNIHRIICCFVLLGFITAS